jgi:hypothetical protein
MAKKSMEDRRREANAQSSRAQITSGGPGAVIATYKGTTMRSAEHARGVATKLRSLGWVVVVDRDNTVTATATYSA